MNVSGHRRYREHPDLESPNASSLVGSVRPFSCAVRRRQRRFSATRSISTWGTSKKPRSSLATALAGIEGSFLVSDGPDLSIREIARSCSRRNPLGSGGMWSSSPRWTCTPALGRDRGTRAARRPFRRVGKWQMSTFIQAAESFMLNALGWSHSIREEECSGPRQGRGEIAFIHPDDIADVATVALTTRDLDGQSCWSSPVPRR